MNNNIRQWMLIKGGAVLLMVFSVFYVYFTVSYMDFFNVYSLIKQGDIIEYNGKVIICIGGIPMFILVFFFSLRNLIMKGVNPLRKSTALGRVWGGFSMLSICMSFIVSFIIPFILMASPYTYCDVGTRSSYYAIRPELCKTIVP